MGRHISYGYVDDEFDINGQCKSRHASPPPQEKPVAHDGDAADLAELSTSPGSDLGSSTLSSGHSSLLGSKLRRVVNQLKSVKLDDSSPLALDPRVESGEKAATVETPSAKLDLPGFDAGSDPNKVVSNILAAARARRARNDSETTNSPANGTAVEDHASGVPEFVSCMDI